MTIHTMRIAALALAGLALAAPGRADQARTGEAALAFAEAGLFELEAAPEAWDRQDPADSLYRAARDAMNRGEHARAATMFRRIWERFPRSSYAPDAPYWEAFNRYRSGETADLESGLESLDVQRRQFPDAGTRNSGDAEALAARIRGQLASRGHEESAAVIAEAALSAAGAAVGPAMEAARQALESLDVAGITQEAMAAARVGIEQARIEIESRRGAQVPEQCREQVETQIAALNALMNMNEDRAMPILKQVMDRRDECAPPLRRRAVFMIADMETPETVDLLLDAARADPDLEVRRQAVFWLSEVEDERAVAALEQFLEQSDDLQIRERAIFALGQHPSPRGRQILRRVAQDASVPTELRSKAIFWLGEEGSPEDVAFLRGLFGRIDDQSLNDRILFAVAEAGGQENAQWLLSVASNRQVDLETRKRAVFWAAEAGISAAQLGQLYDRFQDREMKERVLFALSETDSPEGLDRLIQIARTERDTELRKRAIFWLGNSNDPRAAEVLMEIIANTPGQ